MHFSMTASGPSTAGISLDSPKNRKTPGSPKKGLFAKAASAAKKAANKTSSFLSHSVSAGSKSVNSAGKKVAGAAGAAVSRAKGMFNSK